MGVSTFHMLLKCTSCFARLTFKVGDYRRVHAHVMHIYILSFSSSMSKKLLRATLVLFSRNNHTQL